MYNLLHGLKVFLVFIRGVILECGFYTFTGYFYPSAATAIGMPSAVKTVLTSKSS